MTKEKKYFWIFYISGLLIAFIGGVLLKGYFAAIIGIFVLMVMSLNIAFSKKYPRIAGAHGGSTIGLGLSILYIGVFGL